MSYESQARESVKRLNEQGHPTHIAVVEKGAISVYLKDFTGKPDELLYSLPYTHVDDLWFHFEEYEAEADAALHEFINNRH